MLVENLSFDENLTTPFLEHIGGWLVKHSKVYSNSSSSHLHYAWLTCPIQNDFQQCKKTANKTVLIQYPPGENE